MSVFSKAVIDDFKNEQYEYGSNRIQTIRSRADELVGTLLDEHDINPKDFALLTIGSDGRKENRKDASSIEMIAYNKSGVDKETIQHIAREIGSLFMSYNRASLAKKVYGTNKVEVEPKKFEKIFRFDDPYSTYSTPFPSRFMDGQIIYGEKETYKELVNLFTNEAKTVTAAELNQFRSRVSYAAGITKEGGRKFRDDYIKHFDFEKKEIYYKKLPEIETGIKMGPLRYVQYKLCSIICYLLRNDKIGYDEFQNLEGFMQNKIDFIRPYVKGLDEDRDVADLSLIYYTCLQIHHVCQKRYKQVTGTDPFVFHLDQDENKTLQEMLTSLTKIMGQINLK